MSYSTTIGVDLAKNVIQVSVVSEHGKEQLNRSLTRKKFAEFLGKQTPSLVAFEACASAHYWARTAVRLGHEAKIIPAKSVAPSAHYLFMRCSVPAMRSPKAGSSRLTSA